MDNPVDNSMNNPAGDPVESHMESTSIVSQLIPIVQQVMVGVVKSGDSGPLGKMREAGAAVGYIRTAGERFADNAIIDQVIQAIVKDGAREFARSFNSNDIDVAQVLSRVGELNALLSNLGSSGREIKEFMIELVQKVAEAAGGGFLGSGQKMSAGEFKFIDELKRQLEIV